MASVLYYCPCTGSINSQQDRLSRRTSTLEDLYYCDECSELRCSRCVIDEPAGYHCPNCLFDVPTASVRAEGSCCARNCFHCPVCTHILSVAEHSTSELPFSLTCSLCFWDSREIGWGFDRPTGISAQVDRLRGSSGRQNDTEYNRLLDHWRAIQRGGIVTDYKSDNTLAEDQGSKRVEQLATAEDADTIMFSSDPTQEPRRVRLHMKLAKRCRSCHHILIKPESKAQATRFKIQLTANGFLPAITIPAGQKIFEDGVECRVGDTLPLALRFANPLYTAMQVAIDTEALVPVSYNGDVEVRVQATDFSLPPFTEAWEYDDDEDGANDGRLAPGVVDSHGNRVAIQLHLTPHSAADNLRFPLHLTCTHIDDLDQNNHTVTTSFWVYVSLDISVK